MVLRRVVRFLCAASQCPWHRRGRCLFWHRVDDAGVKPPMTRSEDEIGVELAALWAAVSKMASSWMWRTGQCVDVPVPQVMEEPIMKQSGILAGCGDCTEGSGVGACGEQVKEDVGEVVVELALPPGEARSCGPGECDMTSAAATAVEVSVAEARPDTE